MPKKKVSGGKLLLALFTGGLSLPFTGIKSNAKKRKTPSYSKKKTTVPSRTKIRSLKSRCNIMGDPAFLETDLVESSR